MSFSKLNAIEDLFVNKQDLTAVHSISETRNEKCCLIQINAVDHSLIQAAIFKPKQATYDATFKGVDMTSKKCSLGGNLFEIGKKQHILPTFDPKNDPVTPMQLPIYSFKLQDPPFMRPKRGHYSFNCSDSDEMIKLLTLRKLIPNEKTHCENHLSHLGLHFLQQYRHYQSNLEVFQLKPSSYSKTLEDLVLFIAQVSQCYPDEVEEFPQNLRDILKRHATVLDRTMRMDVMIELYKRNVWNDAKTVNVITTACFSKVTKILVAALKFFLGHDKTEEENSDKTKEKEKSIRSFSEKLFKQLESTNERFEVKLMMIDLISRLVGIHQLFLFNFYPFISTATSESVLMTIANNFITDRNSGEVMAVGLNSVREICARCPLAMSEDLLGDLIQYKKHRDKAVMMAARSLIQLFRQGKPTEASEEHKVLKYGEVDGKEFLPGAEILSMTKTDELKEDDDWESCSEKSDSDEESDDGWIDVHHSSDEEPQDTSNVPENPEERKKKALEISTSRILTQDEFKQIQQRQASKAVEGATKNRKRKHIEIDDEGESRSELLQLSMIENINKKRAHDKESRLSTVMAGREGREKFAKGPQKLNPNASTSNKQKLKNKAFMMVKHKMTDRKNRRSFRDKQVMFILLL
ncbi:LOW QUALITY PROTEIN: hypothetical protein KUTeg_024644 [Tegillarca granosa]|uniref:Protein SDA1 n=1 Tax=Tegillarca granosa TaxID=220873 RepID=A0ABQ9DXZ6_TEGGR|nr:LOW QUALITY PROTEIN: hypothetical protein KUTeg_024644 [Tegillarca granosa]